MWKEWFNLITGALLRDAVIFASERMAINRHIINAMNVFPVPDGDTGTNMSMTLDNAAKELALLDDTLSVAQVAKLAASALMRGARGNSGVILSLIFKGLAKGLQDCESADGMDIARALEIGTDAAYQAVLSPKEGTILTVAREAAQAAKVHAKFENDPTLVMARTLEVAKIALAETPNQLPVLKKANVVDAGGQGLVLVFEAILAVFQGEKRPGEKQMPMPEQAGHSLDAISMQDGEILFGFCTEFFLSRRPESNVEQLQAYLAGMGDSLVMMEEDFTVKVHIHTNEPQLVLGEAREYGELINVKIENMRYQHKQLVGADVAAPVSALPAQAAQEALVPEKRYGMVAVALGAGQRDLFHQFGVDAIVDGGQTVNPSTQEILQAIRSVPAEVVFVLPNNKNIIMTSEQCAQIEPQGKVRVLRTKSIPQGMAATLMLDETASPEENLAAMNEAAGMVSTGLVTFAARDSIINGQAVKRGEILGLEDGKITIVDGKSDQVALTLVKNLFKPGESQTITVLYGAEVKASQAKALEKALKAEYEAEADVAVLDGGQPIYYYVISVE